jgi:predicted nucleotidyltransferase
MMSRAGSPHRRSCTSPSAATEAGFCVSGEKSAGVEETPYLSELERDCLERYVVLLSDRLADELEAIWLFGSAARGDAWWPAIRIRSDIDVVVVTRSRLADDLQEELVNATYPLFLECGRQIGPQFRTVAELEAKQPTAFLENLRREGVLLWRPAT